MLNRFQHGTIVDFYAGEDLKNNDIYVLDPITKQVRKARNCDEWLTCQLVYVYEVDGNRFSEKSDYSKSVFEGIIKKGQLCRCWIAYLVL